MSARAVAWLRRRPAVAAAVIYAAVVVLFLGPALLPGKTLSSSDTLWFDPPWVSAKPSELTRPTNTDLGDASRHLQLFLQATAKAVPDVPLWNPQIMGGRPFQANSQSAVFSPYSLPAYVLPFWTAVSWIGVLKLWVAAFGMFLLARSLGLRFGGALLAGLVFALNLRMVTWLIYNNMGIWALIPWLLLCTERVVGRPDLLAVAGLAVVVALQFLAGHAETSFHALLAAGAFFALRLWQAGRTNTPAPRRTATPIVAFSAGVLGGAALASISLVPLAELLWLSADIRDRVGESVDVHLPLKDVIGVFMPDYWGRPTQTSSRPLLLERALYVGALPLMLAAAALALRRSKERLWIAGFGALWLAVVIGIPPFVQLVTRLPLFSSGHNTRLIILTMLAVSLLAGWGLDDLTEARRFSRPRRRTTILAATALLVTPLFFVVLWRRVELDDLAQALQVALLFADPPGGFGDPVGGDVIRLSSLLAWLALAGAGLALIAMRMGGRLAPVPFVALAILLACVDFFRIGMGYNPAIDREHASVSRTGAIRFLERQGPARFVSTEEIPQNVIPMRFGPYEARGYDLPILRRFDRLWRREVMGGSDSVAAGLFDIPLRFLEPSPRALRALRLLGVQHVLGPKAIWPAQPPLDRLTPVAPLRAPGLKRVYNGDDARVYRVDGALPRAFVVHVQRVVRGEAAALDAVTAANFDGRRVAITEERIGGLPEDRAGDASSGRLGTSARILSYEPERVVVRTRSNGPGLLVLSDNHYPGWKATVDGRPADVKRVDYLFRGVRVGPGTRRVEFRYEPLSWRLGWIVSVVSLLVVAVALAMGWRRRSTDAAPSGSETEDAEELALPTRS